MIESKDPPGPAAADPTLQRSLAPTVSYVRLAEVIGVKPDTLYGWVRAGRIVSPTYFGSAARWTEEQVQQILAAGTQPPGTYPVAESPHAKPRKPKPTKSSKTQLHPKSRSAKPTGKKPPSKKRRAS